MRRIMLRRPVWLLVCVAVPCLAGSALAASGKAIRLPGHSHPGPPSLAVDTSGTAFLAWIVPTANHDEILVCVLPPGGRSCEHSATLVPRDDQRYIDDVQVIADGSTVVVLASVFGSPHANGEHYSPIQEWQSTDGGSTLTAVNGGRSVAAGNPSVDTSPLNAVVVPGTNWLGFGWDTAGSIGPPSFNAFPLSAPPECSFASPCPYATLEPASNPDQLQNQPGQFASQGGALPGVLGVFFTNFTSGRFACSSARTVPFGMAYVYGSGQQSPSNDYNKSPGSAGSAWRFPLTQGDCNVEYEAVAGGPSGFGVLEADELHGSTIYRAFDQATDTFPVGRVTLSHRLEQSPSLSQDAAGGIYATFLDGDSIGPIALAFSATGGVSWAGPTPINRNRDHGASHLTSAVGPTGQGWAAWLDNGAVYAQQFVASDALVPPKTGGKAIITNTTATVRVTCASVPCHVAISVSAGKRKLARGNVVLRRRGAHKVRLKLTRAGRQLRKGHNPTIKARIRLVERVQGQTVSISRPIKIRRRG